VKRQHVFLEHTKLLSLLDTLTIFVSFSLYFLPPILLRQLSFWICSQLSQNVKRQAVLSHKAFAGLCWSKPPIFFDTVPCICSQLSQNGKKTGCPFTEGTCWTLWSKQEFSSSLQPILQVDFALLPIRAPQSTSHYTIARIEAFVTYEGELRLRLTTSAAR
jgi:hypothetical protein